MPDAPEPEPKSEGSPWLKELYDLFAPVRQSFLESGMTEDEINAEIDAALREVRAERRLDARSTEERMRELWQSGAITDELAQRLGLM